MVHDARLNHRVPSQITKERNKKNCPREQYSILEAGRGDHAKKIMKKSLVITKPLADKLQKLPAEVVGGVVKYLLQRIFSDVPEDARYVKFERMAEKAAAATATKEDCDAILSYMNSRLGTQLRYCDSTHTKISARFAEGYTVEDFIIVIDTKAKDWLGTKYASCLRPETLFGTKFGSYRNQHILESAASGFTEGSFDTNSFFTAARECVRDVEITDDCPFLK